MRNPRDRADAPRRLVSSSTSQVRASSASVTRRSTIQSGTDPKFVADHWTEQDVVLAIVGPVGTAPPLQPSKTVAATTTKSLTIDAGVGDTPNGTSDKVTYKRAP